MSDRAGEEGLRSRVRDYYRTVSRYIDREHLDEESRRFWEELAGKDEAGPVLEIGCGTGRVTSALSRDGRRVIGLDLSPEMLERARSRLSGRPNVHLLRADMRRIPVSGPFALVVAASDPFAHMVKDEDRDRAVGEIARLLGPEGRYVAEAHWLDPARLARARRPEGFQRIRPLGPTGDDLRVRETWRCETETRLCVARYEYLRDQRVVDRASFRARLWSLDELRRRLDSADLCIRSLWGSFEREPFDPASSVRLLLEAVPEAGGKEPEKVRERGTDKHP